MGSQHATSLESAAHKRRRADVMRWAQEFGFTTTVLIDDPDAIVRLIGECAARRPREFTHAHGSEIFAWQRELFRQYLEDRAATGDPEAGEALAFVNRRSTGTRQSQS